MSVQISAYVSDETKRKIEEYSDAKGVKKGYLIENAIEYYFQTLHEVPEQFMAPASITLTQKSFEKIANMVANPPEPTDALKDLMRGD